MMSRHTISRPKNSKRCMKRERNSQKGDPRGGLPCRERNKKTEEKENTRRETKGVRSLSRGGWPIKKEVTSGRDRVWKQFRSQEKRALVSFRKLLKRAFKEGPADERRATQTSGGCKAQTGKEKNLICPVKGGCKGEHYQILGDNKKLGEKKKGMRSRARMDELRNQMKEKSQ